MLSKLKIVTSDEQYYYLLKFTLSGNRHWCCENENGNLSKFLWVIHPRAGSEPRLELEVGALF